MNNSHIPRFSFRRGDRGREMADIDGEDFLDFFASPSLSHTGSHHINSTFNTNGSFSTVSHPPQPSNADNDDDDWGDFTGPVSRPHPELNFTSLEFNFSSSNGFPSNPPPRSSSTAFDPFNFPESSSDGPEEVKSNRNGSDSKEIRFEKPGGPLPLSLFGEEEEENGGSVVDTPVNGSNVTLDQKSTQVVVNGTSSHVYIGGSEIVANSYVQSPHIKHQSGLNSDTNSLYTSSNSVTYPNGTNEVFDYEDDWEFRGALSQDGVGGTNFKEQGSSEASRSKGESNAVISQDHKVGQASTYVINNLESVNSPRQFADLYASQNGSRNSAVNNLESINSPHQFADLIASQNGSNNKNNKVNNLESMNSPHQFLDLFSSQNGSSSKNSEVNNLELMNSPHQFTDLFASQNGARNKNSKANNLEPTNSSHQFTDLFALQNGVSNKNNEVDVRTDYEAPSFFLDTFMSYPLANDMETGNANETYPTQEVTDDGFDDFGEFIDAALDSALEDQKYHPTHESTVEAHAQNVHIVDHSTRPESHKQPFLESVFNNGVQNVFALLSSVSVVLENDEHNISVIDKPTFAPKNGSTIRSEKSIQDIISNLYGQDQDVPSVDSSQKPVENGSGIMQKTFDSSSCNNWSYSDNSWNFKNKVGLKENSNDDVQKDADKLQDQKISVDFFARLRDKLHFVALCLLDGAENNEAQEALRALQNDMGSTSHLEKDMSINGCLNDFIEDLHSPNFQIIESEYLLSRRLPLAEKDWRLAIELLKETRLIVKILESGSSDDLSVYISTWSNIISVSAKELRFGALIWKQAVENSLQIQILSDQQGQRYIHGLGEIYRVIQLMGLSAKVCKPWMLLNKGDQSSLFHVLDECSDLWSSSGLEEAFWNLLGSVDSISGQSVEALLESIKHIQEIDVLAMQDCAFFQQKSICQLSLLPEEMLPELNLVSWNGIRCFIKVANCWAHLISHEPPFLPHIRVG